MALRRSVSLRVRINDATSFEPITFRLNITIAEVGVPRTFTMRAPLPSFSSPPSSCLLFVFSLLACLCVSRWFCLVFVVALCLFVHVVCVCVFVCFLTDRW
jgi:hypothetical protein